MQWQQTFQLSLLRNQPANKTTVVGVPASVGTAVAWGRSVGWPILSEQLILWVRWAQQYPLLWSSSCHTTRGRVLSSNGCTGNMFTAWITYVHTYVCMYKEWSSTCKQLSILVTQYTAGMPWYTGLTGACTHSLRSQLLCLHCHLLDCSAKHTLFSSCA